MPVADIEIVMMASLSLAVLLANCFPREINDWEGLSSSLRSLLAGGTRSPFNYNYNYN